MRSNNLPRTRILVEGALMIALASVLSEIKIPLWVQGGSIKLFAMVPLVLMSYRHGLKWGVFTAFVHSVIQMMMGFHNVLYCATLGSQILCILLDYILAYTCLGLAVLVPAALGRKTLWYGAGAAAVCFLRFVCSFLSGIVIWGAYAPEGTPVWIYSLTYNGGYMLPELIITTAGIVLLSSMMPRLFRD